MEKINKKLFYIEKTLNKMKKEISTIKSLTNNTNTTNTLNNSINYINKNCSMYINKDNYSKNKKINTFKNYFKLTKKEKKYYENKEKIKSAHSLNIKSKKTNINNHMIDYSSINNNEDIFFIGNDKNENNKKNKKRNSKELYNNKKFNRMSILNEEINENQKNDSSFENNFDFESHNIFFNYNCNGRNKCNSSVFSNVKKNTHINRKNNFNNFNMDCYKRMNGSLNSKKYNDNYDIQKIKNKTCYDINNIINDNKDENNKLRMYKNKKKTKNCNSLINKNIGNEYHCFNEDEKSVLNNDYNLFHKYHNYIFEENEENNDIQNYEKSENNEKLDEKYSEILNILGGKSIEEINNKAILFDKYGNNGFKNYLNNNNIRYNSSMKNSNVFFENLLNYKKYIIKTSKTNIGCKKKINSYKILCKNLLNLGNGNNIQKIQEKINYKLKKNQHNKKLLEKIQNILYELNNNNIY